LNDKAMGILAISPTYPQREYELAKKLAEDIGVKLIIIETNEMNNPDFQNNPVNRCFYCKHELFSQIVKYSVEKGIYIVVDGSNADDLKDYRPGKSAMKKLNIRSPLQEAGLSKADIRELSRKFGLPTWNKEALACLSSRFAYGEKIDIHKLKKIDEFENFLNDKGFRNVRARLTKNNIKIEVNPNQINLFFNEETRSPILKKAKDLGFSHISVDLEGYRTGSMNENLID